MPNILIHETPPGFAPEEIRKEWIDCIIPLATEDELAEDPVSNLSIGNDNADGYIVLRSKGVESLRQKGAHEAADLWESLPLGRYLRFSKKVCTLQ